MSSVII